MALRSTNIGGNSFGLLNDDNGFPTLLVDFCVPGETCDAPPIDPLDFNLDKFRRPDRRCFIKTCSTGSRTVRAVKTPCGGQSPRVDDSYNIVRFGCFEDQTFWFVNCECV